MKILISIFFVINVFAVSGVGYGDDLRIQQPILDITFKSGVGYGDDLRKLDLGEYDFDSYSNRWLLKTKSRLLSVKDLDIVNKYSEKQNEVKSVSNQFRYKFRDKLSTKSLERRVKRKVKFKNYKFEDFEY